MGVVWILYAYKHNSPPASAQSLGFNLSVFIFIQLILFLYLKGFWFSLPQGLTDKFKLFIKMKI